MTKSGTYTISGWVCLTYICERAVVREVESWVLLPRTLISLRKMSANRDTKLKIFDTNYTRGTKRSRPPNIKHRT